MASVPRLGEQLVLRKVITPQQLEKALEIQQNDGGRLGSILVSLGYATAREIEENASVIDVSFPLGEMLVRDGAITQAQLNRALEYQKISGGRLGDILLSLNFISTEKLYKQIAIQFKMGRTGKQLNLQESKRLPFSVAQNYKCVIVHDQTDRYLLAVAQRLDANQLATVEHYMGKPIEMVLASQSEIDTYWSYVYAEDLTGESIYKLANETPENSAIRTFSGLQFFTIVLISLVLIVSVLLFRIRAFVVMMYLIEVLSLALLLFKIYISWKGATVDSQIRITKEELNSVDERNLPVYTILVPMYKEKHLALRLFQSLEEINYPKAKLDIKFLLEADDTETIKKVKELNLPSYYSVLIIPDSYPKTKPKACNYGLIHARGEYVVIYDAEDRPEPDQLKKVYLAFQKLPKNCICIQSKLNYYNSSQNIITKWCTQEYSMWFEQVLPGVTQLDIPVPLGGTSNHFKTEYLKNVGAWDPFNVTEDCDLGTRLYKAGYTTAVIDSRTWEEANSEVGNWIRQRSRWMKGYMQTWLVHTRHPIKLLKELKLRGFLGFQATILGTLVAVLVNPFLLALFIMWFVAKPHWIQLLFPTPVYYIALFLFIIGNFYFIYSSVVGTYFVINDMVSKGRRGVLSYSLVKYTVLLPVYWLLMSVASYKALAELIIRPSHWEKTDHGLTEERHNTLGVHSN
jgi:glycosyltransferase XagB